MATAVDIQQSVRSEYPGGNSFHASMGYSTGLSTVGFRTNKCSPEEWNTLNYQKYHQALTDRETSQKLREDSKSLIKEVDAVSAKNQAESTKRLLERVHDINFWKGELEREIQDVDDETRLLVEQKRRLDNALIATELPLHIATDNLNCRDKRYGSDRVEDEPEEALIREIDVVNKVQMLLKSTIDHANEQIQRNRDAKEMLEMDWSNKLEAEENDGIAAALRNGSTNKQFYAGVARYQENMSDPETWARESHDHISAAEQERAASIELRQLIDNILRDTSRDMRQQADMVEASLTTNIDRLIDALCRLQDNLKKTCGEIAQQEKNIEEIKAAIRAKEDPIKVVQTRLHQRNFRPGTELCKDPAQDKLLAEMADLQASLDALEAQKISAENSLKNLLDTRITLEKEIQMKKNSISIDQVKVLPRRSRYPSVLKLQGYNA